LKYPCRIPEYDIISTGAGFPGENSVTPFNDRGFIGERYGNHTDQRYHTDHRQKNEDGVLKNISPKG
jgi:hypothetical protein